jgi:hypothetical protein
VPHFSTAPLRSPKIFILGSEYDKALHALEENIYMGEIWWNTHALLTYHSLIGIADEALHRRIPVASLESFLFIAAPRLEDLFRRYWKLFLNRELIGVSHRELERALDNQGFLLASGLHPDYQISYVRLVGNPDALGGSHYNTSRLGPPRKEYQDVKCDDGDAMSVLEILCTYSDEPDWGMDQGLFSIPTYNYGSPPLGQSKGEISQSFFHTNFLHENIVLLKLFPQIRVNFMEHRIRLFAALSKLAFDVKVDYWGWRFLAWAMHYLQDITQPYHARVCPLPIRFVLALLLKEMSLQDAVRKNMSIVVNHHNVYEKFVHYVLNKSHEPISADCLLQALATGKKTFSGCVASVLYEASATPAQLAPQVDMALRRAIASPHLDDPGYGLDSGDAECDMGAVTHRVTRDRPDALRRLLHFTCDSLENTGEATRHMIRTSRQQQETGDESYYC